MKRVKQRSTDEIKRIDSLFQEIGAGAHIPVSFREAQMLCAVVLKERHLEKSAICGKLQYPSQREAEKVILSRKRKGAGRLRSYRCEECKCFHISSSFR